MKRMRRQLTKELLAALGPWEVVAGAEAAEVAREAVQSRSDALAASLASEQPQQVAESVLAALWGSGEPSAAWWRSPLGRALGAVLPDAPMTHQVAAEILGVQRGTVSVLVQRGTLASVDQPRPAGPGRPTDVRQVSRRAVLARLARLEARRPRSTRRAAVGSRCRARHAASDVPQIRPEDAPSADGLIAFARPMPDFSTENVGGLARRPRGPQLRPGVDPIDPATITPRHM